MRMHIRCLLLGSLFGLPSFLSGQVLAKRFHQVGDNQIEIRAASNNPEYVYSATITQGRRSYEVRMKGKEVKGDIRLPKAKELVYTNAWLIPNQGLKADAMVLLPDWGLVGYAIEHRASDSSSGLTHYGNVQWRIDPATGTFEECALDEIVVFHPYDFILAERVLFIKKQATENIRKPGHQADGFMYASNKKTEEWPGMEVMTNPKKLIREPIIFIKRFIYYRDAYLVIGQKRGGFLCKTMVFDQKLQAKKSYFPSLVVYKGFAKVPYKIGHYLGNDVVARYRKGTWQAPDELFEWAILVPSQSYEGLYGLLSPDGTVEIPEGSLGLSPMLTTEQVAGIKDSTYLLSHFFVVSYPGTEDQLHFGIAGPDGKVSQGSLEKPAWESWFMQTSEVLQAQVKYSVYHSDLIVAKQANGLWQGFLPAQYFFTSAKDATAPFYPKAVGKPDTDPAQALANTEEQILMWDSISGVKQAANQARIRAEGEKWAKLRAARQDSLHQVSLRNQPPPPQRAPISIRSNWEGFTYTSQTTARFNQTVQTSSGNNSMREYNRYLNAKIYRRW